MRVLVTGANEFVGSSFVLHARAAGHEVLGVARRPSAHGQADISSQFIDGFIDDFQPALVFHAAGSAAVARSLEQPFDDYQDSLGTWVRALESVRRSRMRPLVMFPSSAAVYGDPRALPVHEDTSPAPVSPYGFHKLACEVVAREYTECFGLDVTVFRIFSLVGPRQRRLLIYELFEQACSSAAEIALRGTGDETRDYLHVDDAVAPCWPSPPHARRGSACGTLRQVLPHRHATLRGLSETPSASTRRFAVSATRNPGSRSTGERT